MRTSSVTSYEAHSTCCGQSERFGDHMHLISGSVFELLKKPMLRDWLEEDWSRANLAIEEFLRFVSAVQFSKPRYVRKDVTLDGVELKKGDHGHDRRRQHRSQG